jgi:AP endonuclease-2
VVIYTRNATCAPIRAEEGITGILCPPNSTTSFRDLPSDQQIGGYPSIEQLSEVDVDASTLDSEGRCVILEFPAFVLLGVYCPAARDETRDDFRYGFVRLLEARIRNLAALGKRVFLTGDLNISSSELDSAHLKEAVRKGTGNEDEFVSTPVRRIFNQLVGGCKVVGGRDEGRESPILYDICRAFHPNRKGMYTCWETRVNARPGNYGARIDYVLCTLDMKNWWSDSNIQEGLMVGLSRRHGTWLTIQGIRSLSGLRHIQREITDRWSGGRHSRHCQSAGHVQKWSASA